MEATSNHLELVHVLRHSFRPSQQLEESLGEFIKPGHEKPRFLLKTMSSLAIDATHQHDIAINKAIYDARMNLENDPIELRLAPQIAGQRLANGAFRLYFGLTNNSAGLLISRQNLLAKELPHHTRVIDGPYGAAQLTTTISAERVFASKEGVGIAGARLKKALKLAAGTNSFVVHSDGIPGIDEQRIVETRRAEYLQDSAS